MRGDRRGRARRVRGGPAGPGRDAGNAAGPGRARPRHQPVELRLGELQRQGPPALSRPQPRRDPGLGRPRPGPGRRSLVPPRRGLELATSDSGCAELSARIERLASWGYPARLIDTAEAAELEPALLPRDEQATAAWFPGEAYLLTEPLIERLVAYLTSQGGTVLTGEQGHVTGLDAGPGDTPRIRTADGAVIEADEAVCCAGRWTPGWPRWPERRAPCRWCLGTRPGRPRPRWSSGSAR